MYKGGQNIRGGKAKWLQYYDSWEGGGSSQMITIDYNRGMGVYKKSKNDYVIFEQPLTTIYSKIDPPWIVLIHVSSVPFNIQI